MNNELISEYAAAKATFEAAEIAFAAAQKKVRAITLNGFIPGSEFGLEVTTKPVAGAISGKKVQAFLNVSDAEMAQFRGDGHTRTAIKLVGMSRIAA